MASVYDTKPLSEKIVAAMNEAAEYFANPASTPTPQQLALAQDYANCGRITFQFVSIACQREGLSDESTYQSVSGKLAAMEAELIKLFF
jgi:hypothetical protein